MKQIVRVFMNHKVFPNCCMIVMKDLNVTKHENKGNVCVLYHEDEIIGYNITDERFANYSDGYHAINEELLNEINDILKNVSIDEIDADMENRFKVGMVKECLEHPESDHLHICKVDIGSDILQIVCGSHNVEEGIKVVVACENAVMPNGKIICAGKLRGVDSYGMLCSAYELGLIDESKKGLLILDERFNVGEEFRGDLNV